MPSANKVDFSLESVLTSDGKSQTLVKSHGKIFKKNIKFYKLRLIKKIYSKILAGLMIISWMILVSTSAVIGRFNIF